MVRRLLSLLALVCVSALAVSGRCDPLTDALRKEDPRLEKPVTLDAPRLYIGELLERLSAQSGISLTANTRDGAADVRVTAFLKDVPLGDVMDALWALVSYKRATWRWERSGGPGGFRYRLTRPVAAQQLAARLQNWAQEAFETQAATLLAAARMTPEQRKQFRNRLIEAFPGDEKAVERALQDDSYWIGLRLFAMMLSPERQLRVLRGQESPRIPISQLSGEGQAFARSDYHGPPPVIIHQGAESPAPTPGWIQFQTDRGGPKATPSLYVLAGITAPGIETASGQAYIGGTPLEQAFRKVMHDLWMLPGDKADDPASERKVAPPRRPSPETGNEDERRIWEKRMKQLAEAAPIALMARLPSQRLADPGPPYNQTVKQYLQRLENWPIMHKWRGNVLLVSSRTWHLEEEAGVSRRLVEQLRQAEKAGGGFLSFDDLASIADLLSEEQMKGLTEEFPVMATVALWRPLLRLCYASPQVSARLRSKTGLPLTGEVVSALRSMRHSPFAAHLDKGTARAIRLVETQGKEGDTPIKIITFPLIFADGEILTGTGFRYRARSSNKTPPRQPAR